MNRELKEKGLCNQQKVPVEFFVHDKEDPRHEQMTEIAKAVCGQCPVRDECFLTGISNGEQGVWGGVFLDGPDEEDTKDLN